MKLKNIFLHDTNNNLKNLSSNISNVSSTTIIAEKGNVERKVCFIQWPNYFIPKKFKNEIIKFEQLNINLENLTTTTIKKPKIQETSTLKLLSCFLNK